MKNAYDIFLAVNDIDERNVEPSDIPEFIADEQFEAEVGDIVACFEVSDEYHARFIEAVDRYRERYALEHAKEFEHSERQQKEFESLSYEERMEYVFTKYEE
jgi:hypothetical protein